MPGGKDQINEDDVNIRSEVPLPVWEFLLAVGHEIP